MRQIVVFYRVALVIQAVAVILQIVEPDLVRLPGDGDRPARSPPGAPAGADPGRGDPHALQPRPARGCDGEDGRFRQRPSGNPGRAVGLYRLRQIAELRDGARAAV